MGCCNGKSQVFEFPPTHSETKEHQIPYEGTEQWASTEKTFIQNVRVAQKGTGSQKPRTIHALFKEAVANCGEKPCLHLEDPAKYDQKIIPAAEWRSTTYAEYYANNRMVARRFIDLGLESLDAVNVYGFNSPEWFMSSFAAVFAGGVTAGIYPSDTPAQVMYKSLQSGGVIAVVEGKKQAAAFSSVIDQLPKLKAIVQWADTDSISSDGFTRADGSVVRHLSFASLLSTENPPTASEEDLDARIQAQQPGSVCTYIYTSGTTGNPKAVMITHDNIIYEASTVCGLINTHAGVGTETERLISYLPLSHVAGMMVDIICPIVCAADLKNAIEVYFARPTDLRKGTIGDRLRAVKPTLFLGVPRVWEKIAAKMKAIVKATPPSCIAACIINKGKSVGLQHQKNSELGGTGARPFCMCAANMVSNKVRGRLGLECCKFGFTGAAPITVETLSYFGQLGLQINEVYGMSECCGATTISIDQAHIWGSCGFRMPGTEVKVFQPNSGMKECPPTKDIFSPKEDGTEEGEICFRGRHVMAGYMANPDLGEDHVQTIKKKLADAIDEHGWLHSGDKGCIGLNGMVKITGRYKELIIGAGGENVAPVPIEAAVKAECPAISNCMMVGDQKPFMAAFVTLKVKGNTGAEPGGEELDAEALELEKGVTTVSQAMKSESYKAKLFELVKSAAHRAAPSNAARIRKICILPSDFSISTGELGPTLKLKRSVVMKKQMAAFENMYSAENKPVSVVDYVAAASTGSATNSTAAVIQATTDAPATVVSSASPVVATAESKEE